MEARKYEEFEEFPEMAESFEEGEPLSQEYIPLEEIQKQNRSSQQRELSFFVHVASYSVLFLFLYPLLNAIIPFSFLSLIIALFLPIGVILGSKKLAKKYLL